MFKTLALLLLFLQHCHPYGFIGHKFTAALLWDLLPSSTRHQCLGFPRTHSNRLNRLTFIKLACRPDRIKHRPGMEWAQPLHFFNTADLPPVHCQGEAEMAEAAQVEPPNLIQAARNYTALLAQAPKPLSKDDRSQILAFMVHFLTDLHQPLHLSSKLQGGNKVQVLFDGHKCSLHSLWDTHLILKLVQGNTKWQLKRHLAKRIRLNRMMKRDRIPAKGDCISYWAAETNKANCRVVWQNYSEGADLSGDYYKQSVSTLLDLLVLAALRTSNLIETVCMYSRT